MKIQAFADLTGISVDTLRYYEKLQLLQPARNAGGQREYSEADAAWLAFILRLKATDMPLAEIGEYARLRHAGESTLDERLTMLLSHRERLAEKQRQLAEHQMHLDNKIALYRQMMKNAVQEAPPDEM